MHPRQVIFVFGLLAILTPSALFALEAATRTNDRASNATLFRHLAAERASQLSDINSLDAQVSRLLTCTSKGRFYTPGKSGADADGCTDIEVTVN